MIVEVFNNLFSVFNMSFNAKRKCFCSLKEKKCVKRRKCCACVTKNDCANVCYECCRTYCVCKADAVITRVWIGNLWEFARCLPIKLAAFNDYTAECRSVTADKFCCRESNDVCAVFKRTDEVRRCECVINNKRNVVLVRDVCNSLNVDDV